MLATGTGLASPVDLTAAGPRAAALTELLALPEPLPLRAAGDGVSDIAGAAARALLDNPDVAAARSRAEQARLGHEAARAALRPRADLRLSSGRGRLESTDPDRLLDREDHGLVMRQPLLDAGAWREAGRQVHLAESARAQAAQVRTQVLLDTANAVLSLAQARIGLHVAEAHEAVLLDLQRQVRDESSPHAAADRDRIAARLANVRTGLSSSRAAVQAALRSVERLTGELPGAVRLSTVPDVREPADDREALAAMRDRNDDLLAARADLRAAEADVAVREARFLPRVELEISHLRSLNAGGLPARFQDTRALAVMTLPLWAGGADLALRRQALARVDEASARLRSVELRLTQELETAYSDLQSGAERYRSIRAELASNARVAEAFRLRSYGPDLPINDVLDAHQRVAQSRTDLVQVVVSVTQTRWRLARLTGGLEAGLLGAHDAGAAAAAEAAPATGTPRTGPAE
jgi:adhesin transport system outer membrane protein